MTPNIQKRLNIVSTNVEKELRQALTLGCEVIKKKSLEYTPKDKGHLRNTLDSETYQFADKFIGTIFYTASYSWWVNTMEDRFENVNWTEPGTGSHFLKRAFDEELPTVEKMLERAVKLAIRKSRI